MSDEEKREALERFERDLEELGRERENPAYPRVVRDAIEETIERYKRDVAYLRGESLAAADDDDDDADGDASA